MNLNMAFLELFIYTVGNITLLAGTFSLYALATVWGVLNLRSIVHKVGVSLAALGLLLAGVSNLIYYHEQARHAIQCLGVFVVVVALSITGIGLGLILKRTLVNLIEYLKP